MVAMRNAYRISVGKPERIKSLVSPKHRWTDDIVMDLNEIGHEIVDWIHVALDSYWCRTVVNTAIS
jgi:hypothetical protein